MSDNIPSTQKEAVLCGALYRVGEPTAPDVQIGPRILIATTRSQIEAVKTIPLHKAVVVITAEDHAQLLARCAELEKALFSAESLCIDINTPPDQLLLKIAGIARAALSPNPQAKP